MMSARADKTIEDIIRNSAFPNPAHKDALRGRLFDGDVPLDLDDLETVTGGKALPVQEKWLVWPEFGKDESKY